MAIPDVIEAVRLAKILVFVIPHQFISGVCEQIKSHVTEGTIGISLIKVTLPLVLPSPHLVLLLPPTTFNIPILTHFLFTSSSSPPGSDSDRCCLQGIDAGPGGLRLISDIIREKLEIDVSVLMGANIASEVAAEKFCESTIGGSVSLLLACAAVSLQARFLTVKSIFRC